MLSLQVGPTQMLAEEHTPVEQSGPVPQPLPMAHLFGQLPPQSTSVSVPFLIPSVQLACTQLPLTQWPDAQSESLPQEPPILHAGQAPPQSTSVSFWFFVPSAQL